MAIKRRKIIILNERRLTSKPLLNYLEKRQIPLEIADRFCREIDFLLYGNSIPQSALKIMPEGMNYRRSYGKGKRSICYAACLIGLLDLCSERKSPFTYLLMMDSPLTTYEEKKKQAVNQKDALQGNILKSFFKDIVKLPKASQVIINSGISELF